MAQMIADAFRDTWWNMMQSFALFLPRLLAMLAILLIGFVTAWVLAWLTRQVLGWLRLSTLAQRMGGGEALRRAGFPPPEAIGASLVYWVVLIGFMLSAMGVLGLAGTQTVVADFTRFVPQLMVAIVLLIVGVAVGNFAWRATLLAAVNAQIPSARLLSALVRVLVIVLAVAMALDQVAIARGVVLTAFAIVFGALMLGLAIALGIGGAGTVKRVLEEQMQRRGPAPDSDPISHL